MASHPQVLSHGQDLAEGPNPHSMSLMTRLLPHALPLRQMVWLWPGPTWAEDTAYKTQVFQIPHGYTEVIKTETLTRETRDNHKVCLGKEARPHHDLFLATG